MASRQNPCSWYSLDESDNDSYRFISYFVRAINKATDNVCVNSLALIEKRQFSSLHSLFGEIFAELTSTHHEIYLVLDDYHLITNEEVHEAMRFFIKHMPDNITVVVTSRSNPPLGTANLRVRDLMIEIDDDLLAFDTEETSRFLSMRTKEEIDESTATDLRNYVEAGRQHFSFWLSKPFNKISRLKSLYWPLKISTTHTCGTT